MTGLRLLEGDQRGPNAGPPSAKRLAGLAALLLSIGCARPLSQAAPPEPRVRIVVSHERLVRSPEHGIARLATACNPGSPEQREAEEAVGRLSLAIGGLDAGGGFVPALVALEEVLGARCFRLADRERPDRFAFDGPLALKSWWSSGGGFWIASYLDLFPRDGGAPPPGPEPERAQPVEVVVPPDTRRTLSATLPPRHPLRFLLCPPQARGCGAETAPWLARAEAAFAAHAEAALADAGGTPARCADAAIGAAPDARYAVWRACIEGLVPQRKLAPIDALRAPRQGWLTLRGFRDGPGGCEDLRAYDLATGSAYIATSCRPRGGGAPLVRAASGRLPVEALREAALAALLAPELETGVGEARVFPLPEGISRVRAAQGEGPIEGSGAGPGEGSGEGSSDASTPPEPAPLGKHRPISRIGWTWEHRGLLLAEGALDWPSSSDAGQDHAAVRLRAAERKFESGCSPSVLPKPLRFSGAAGEDPDDAPRPNPALERQLKRLRWRPCTRKPTPSGRADPAAEGGHGNDAAAVRLAGRGGAATR